MRIITYPLNNYSLMKFLFTLCLISVTTLLSAQKLDGTWEMVARKGNTPCAIDVRLVFGKNGSTAQIIYGSTNDDCEQSSTTFANWTIAKEEIKRRSGKTDKVKMINFLNEEEAEVQMMLMEYEGDYLLVMAEMYDGYDSTTNKKVIFKRVE